MNWFIKKAQQQSPFDVYMDSLRQKNVDEALHLENKQILSDIVRQENEAIARQRFGTVYNTLMENRQPNDRYLKNIKNVTLKKTLEKLYPIKEEALAGKYKKHLMFVAAAAASVIGISLIADSIIDHLKSKNETVKDKKFFEEMLKAHPQLQKEDPAVVAQYWSSLRKFSPTLSEDPIAAGAYITQSIRRVSGSEFGGPPPETFKTLSDIEKNVQMNKGMSSGFSSDTRAAVTDKLIQDSLNYQGYISGVM